MPLRRMGSHSSLGGAAAAPFFSPAECDAGKAAKFGRDLLDHQGAIRVQLGSGLHRKHLARLAGEFHHDTRQGRPVGVRGERGGCPERRQALETYLRWDVYRP